MKPADTRIGLPSTYGKTVQGIISGCFRLKPFHCQNRRPGHHHRIQASVLRQPGQHIAALVLAVQLSYGKHFRQIILRNFHPHHTVNRSLVHQRNRIGNHMIAVAFRISLQGKGPAPIGQIPVIRIRVQLCRFIRLEEKIVTAQFPAFTQMEAGGPKRIQGNTLCMGKAACPSFQQDIRIISRISRRIGIPEINAVAGTLLRTHAVVCQNEKGSGNRIFSHHIKHGVQHIFQEILLGLFIIQKIMHRYSSCRKLLLLRILRLSFLLLHLRPTLYHIVFQKDFPVFHCLVQNTHRIFF